jgi:hypothetical protein
MPYRRNASEVRDAEAMANAAEMQALVDAARSRRRRVKVAVAAVVCTGTTLLLGCMTFASEISSPPLQQTFRCESFAGRWINDPGSVPFGARTCVETLEKPPSAARGNAW